MMKQNANEYCCWRYLPIPEKMKMHDVYNFRNLDTLPNLNLVWMQLNEIPKFSLIFSEGIKMGCSNMCLDYSAKPRIEINSKQLQPADYMIQDPNNSFDNQKLRVVQDKESRYNFEVS